MGGKRGKTARQILAGKLLYEICMRVFIGPASSFLLRHRAPYACAKTLEVSDNQALCI